MVGPFGGAAIVGPNSAMVNTSPAVGPVWRLTHGRAVRGRHGCLLAYAVQGQAPAAPLPPPCLISLSFTPFADRKVSRAVGRGV